MEFFAKHNQKLVNKSPFARAKVCLNMFVVRKCFVCVFVMAIMENMCSTAYYMHCLSVRLCV